VTTGPSRSLIGVTVAFAVVLTVLLGLGLWQLQRLHWKLALIEHIAERVHAPPTPIERVLASSPAELADAEYTHVALRGRFRHEAERYLYATAEGDWGWDVITPLELEDGRKVLVNRGYVPRARKDRATRAAGLSDDVITVTGLLRVTPGGHPWWMPAGDPAKGEWFWPEIGAMAATMYSEGRPPVTSFYIDADPIAGAAPPVGGATKLDLPNRHLEYALTWFGLAGVLTAIYALFAYRQLFPSRRISQP